MSKKKSKHKKTSDPVKKENAPVKEEKDMKELGTMMLLVLTLLLAIVYFVFSTFSDGFYQHDEVANFMAAQRIWHDDLLQILGANTKSGYRMLYAIPALAGFTFMKFFNSVVAALTVYFTYRILEKLGSKNKLLIFFILGIQPLWFMLSFRNYAELTVAFLLVLSTLLFYKKKYIWSALIMSYVAFTRQEYHLLLGLLFIVLLFKKEWVSAVLTGTFTVIQNLIGWMITGDFLYLPHSMMEYSENIKGAWPKQGFDHYFLLANVIFGSIAVTLFVAYIAIILVKKKKPHWYLLVPVLLIFLLNCAFNAQSFEFGPGNGGNLRYLIIISPIVSILGVRAIDEVMEFNKRYLLLVFLIPLLLLVGMYHVYDHNFIHLLDGYDGREEVLNWKPLVFSLIVSVLLLLPLKQKHYLVSIAIIALMVGVTSITARKIQPEERAVKKAAKWYAKHLTLGKNPQTAQNQLFNESSRVACGHALFYFYLGKNKYDFEKEALMGFLNKETVDTLKKGDLVIWESHYGYRPKLVPTAQPYDYYEKSPDFRRIQYYQSTDNRFTIVFFQKTVD